VPEAALPVSLMSHDDDRDAPEAAEPDDAQPSSRGPLAGMAAPYIMIGAFATGMLIGYLIDQALGTTPWWAVGMTGFFLVVGIYHMIRDSQR